MSVSEAPDEGSSRGRTSSRWWEAESIGASSTRLERTKRESKYMGVPKEAREALQWMEDPETVPPPSNPSSSSEYPPEKTGWHEQTEQVVTPQALHNSLTGGFSSPNTPNPSHLDVSRLVTLPPPYPRHHPAVNNNHPELTAIRTTVRTISDLSEVDATKQRFLRESRAMREEASEAAKTRKQSLRVNLQQEIAAGNMTYAEAAAIEADSNEAEKGKVKELEKKDHDRFQAAVVEPLNALLTTRIDRATALFNELQGRLFVETRQPSPNMPQEEGDEQPELLEKLTLLKWIFEAREMLHRAIYDLLSDRNDRFREMIVTSYRLVGNEEKVAEAASFFAGDAAKRASDYAEAVLRRTQEFRDVVEENVSRGVEVQLSAFWDIAPPLKRLLDEIPADLAGFRTQIPAAELVENPSYHAHPLQYLFSLLLHSEKSAYQFIESQTNLLCLLHEVKEAVAAARARVMMERGDMDVDEVEAARTEEGQLLTDDLKEKVRVVQDQWRSALGETIVGVKERVGEWLLQTGGWDESLEDRGVGSL
ncbi:lifeguard 2 protein [Pleurostoma richardsiae]|uniref:Lifeguard 2 protein n=1 Tax=Pleurostoma richardsiae TaxID=41990 RepID=A0AA38R7V0_9PEZI|nr:lifeguard 2 protein [Pleurostoma richardsiae]